MPIIMRFQDIPVGHRFRFMDSGCVWTKNDNNRAGDGHTGIGCYLLTWRERFNLVWRLKEPTHLYPEQRVFLVYDTN